MHVFCSKILYCIAHEYKLLCIFASLVAKTMMVPFRKLTVNDNNKNHASYKALMWPLISMQTGERKCVLFLYV